ncbi:allophanate hydrolase subunit 1 [Psychromonas sp. psych-6C06]|uniref:5-oxoprolinase subunit B family protein n=1 Tax=Psychromonas sp. psych-6C06 TaxID=2058089 RepID=UPI000C348140|nr:allophanate hydrolase subunit 1 [Psychromonas sp. psych-6C06]PKF62788.1 allophanate hydrolase subunit 1 [Psychromonas sp. psych-6C06]
MIKAVNENSFLITLSDRIDLSLTSRIAHLVKQIDATFPKGSLLDVTPSYTTALVQINLLTITPLVAETLLLTLCDEMNQSADTLSEVTGKLIELPVYYDQSVGWDLQKVASDKCLSIEQVIALHSDKPYQVCAVGFAPGFAFLAALDAKICQPRHTSPRAFVPAGSVAIADTQTAVYPSDSPGGWHIIGNCPLTLFDTTQVPISPFQIGDRVKFNPITRQQFIALGGKVTDE